ncbi:unnamed protein product [Symbiodinium sp. CCMP2592]|nr:unnamed protein product [Symbiodinium sp. CCMP2592]
MSRLLSLVSKFAVYVQTLLLLLSLVAQPQSPLRCSLHQDAEGLTGAFFYLETASLVVLCTLVTYQLLVGASEPGALPTQLSFPTPLAGLLQGCGGSVPWSLKCRLHVTLLHLSETPQYCDILLVQMASGRTLVFGGRGFVGAAICKELAKRGLTPVLSLSRSQPAQSEGSTIQEVGGVDALKPETFESLLPDARAVVIAIGEPPWVTDKERAMRSNGTTNITIMQTAAKHKVPRVVLVNATMPSWGVIAGYREGKLAAEREALSYPEKCDSPCSVLVIKPGAISGTRQEGCFQVPLWLLLEPMRLVMSALSGPCEAIERCFPSLFGGVLRPPVRVEEIAMAAADVVEDTSFKGIREIGTKELVGYTSAGSQKKD